MNNLFSDQTKTNSEGGLYVNSFQAAVGRTRLFKLSFSPLAGNADAYVWVFDRAAGVVTDKDPRLVRFVPAGMADTWDLGTGGMLFWNGIYCLVSTVAPTNASTEATQPSDDGQLIITAEIG